MPMFLVTLLRSGPEWDPSSPLEGQSDWPAHAAFMDGLVDDGLVLLGGPLSDEYRVVHVVEAKSEAEIRERLASDPWSGSHLVVDSVEPWTIRLDSRRVLSRSWRECHRQLVESHSMVPEAPLEGTETGLVPASEGWYVLSARMARWRYAPGRGAYSDLEGAQDFPQLGFNIVVLGPGEPMSMYHWEADQEDFLVVSGEALLIVEGEERPLRQWDFVHCPSGTKHTIVGVGEGPAVVVAVGARQHQDGPGWGGYTVDEVALRHDAGVEEETNDPDVAYARFVGREHTRFHDDWLPG